MSLGRNEPGAAITEAVDVAGDFQHGLNPQFVRLQEIVNARGMDAEQRNHGYGGGDLELNVVT